MDVIRTGPCPPFNKMKPELVQAMERHARSDVTNEVCGFVYADHYLPLPNRNPDPSHFEAEPSALARALSNHGEPLAIFHSHPNGILVPSRQDLTQSYYNHSMIIIGAIGTGKFQYRMYRILRGGTYEVVAPPQEEPAPAVHP